MSEDDIQNIFLNVAEIAETHRTNLGLLKTVVQANYPHIIGLGATFLEIVRMFITFYNN